MTQERPRLILGYPNLPKYYYAMRPTYTILFVLFLIPFSAIGNKRACDYVGSNLGYIKSQTQQAIKAEDINFSRYYAYKALNAIEKSRTQFEACGCDYALKSIDEGLENLKKATRIGSLKGAKILLKRALESTYGSLEALEKHDELHVSLYASDLLAMNTKTAAEEKLARKMPKEKDLHNMIDKALVNFKNSLDEVVKNVNCREAYDFASKIYAHCSQELLRKDLTPGKKYYNFRTKEITENALRRLESCGK